MFDTLGIDLLLFGVVEASHLTKHVEFLAVSFHEFSTASVEKVHWRKPHLDLSEANFLERLFHVKVLAVVQVEVGTIRLHGSDHLGGQVLLDDGVYMSELKSFLSVSPDSEGGVAALLEYAVGFSELVQRVVHEHDAQVRQVCRERLVRKRQQLVVSATTIHKLTEAVTSVLLNDLVKVASVLELRVVHHLGIVHALLHVILVARNHGIIGRGIVGAELLDHRL